MEIGISNSVISMAGGAVKDAADARARGTSLVTPAHIAEVFENATTTEQVTLRHRQSGLLCRQPGLVLVAPASEVEVLSASNKAICTNFANGFQNDLGITRNDYKLSAVRAVAAIAAEMRAETTGLHETGRPVIWDQATMDRQDASKSASTRLTDGKKEAAKFFYISAVVVKGWIVWNVVRGAADKREGIENVGNIMLNRALEGMN
jgi:hypothetical protein